MGAREEKYAPLCQTQNAKRMMQAAKLVSYGEPEKAFELREMPKPKPKAHEALIKVEGFGLNFADVMARQGLYRDAPPLPAVIGYEVVGHVEAVGDELEAKWIGKRVVAFTRFGGYAEYVAVPDLALAEIPEDLPIAEATALCTQYVTAYFSATEAVRLHPGDRILIHSAAGGVGTALVQLAKWKQAEVVALAGSDEKCAAALANGADHALNYRKIAYEHKLKKRSIDVSFNAVGGKTVGHDRKLLRPGGRLVLYGAAQRNGAKGGNLANIKLLWDMGVSIPIFLMMQSQAIIGVNMLRIADHHPLRLSESLNGVVALYRQGHLHPKSGGVFPISQLADAHHLLGSGQSMGKIAVTW